MSVKGKIAAQFGYDLEVEILRSHAGYYIGTASETEGPVSRESNYYQEKKDAEYDLVNRSWIQREEP